MSHHDRPHKVSKLLRSKAQEFLSSRRYSNNLVDIVKHFNTGADPTACLLSLELIFAHLLKEKEMVIEIVPLKPVEPTPEHQYRDWLRNIYEECFIKVVGCCEHGSSKVQIQALACAMNLLACEGRCPLEAEARFPVNRLKLVLMRMLSSKSSSSVLINKFEEYLSYDDVLFYTWKVLPQLTAKSNPNELYISNYLALLEKLGVYSNKEQQLLCSTEGHEPLFAFDEALVKRNLNKLWHCVMLWEHNQQTHKQLLIVLLERILPHLDKPLLLTDFLMDSLDMGGPVGLLALQGIFTLMQSHNLDYPNIFAKLYSMFEPEIFHTKYKARLFYLSDLFLSSTHLPENLVAAFAKRLARLALIAPSEDVIIICMFVGNLILRHPGLKCLLNRPTGGTTTTDPYIMDERDPMKSNALNSSLWEIQSLQRHAVPDVAAAACFMNGSLPSVEWDLSAVLDRSADDVFDKEIRKQSKLIVLAFQQPNGMFLSKGDRVLECWNLV